MNTVAKSKVEKIINKEIQEKIDAYKRKRRNELDALIEKHEKQPSKEALAIQTKLTHNKREHERLEKELEAVGFKLNYSDKLTLYSETHWDDKYRNRWEEYFVAELTQHSKDTTATVNKLEVLGRQYGLKIWAGEASEEVDVFTAFEKELSKLLT